MDGVGTATPRRVRSVVDSTVAGWFGSPPERMGLNVND